MMSDFRGVGGSKRTPKDLTLQGNNHLCKLANSGFLKNFLFQGGVKSTVSWVFEDLKFKISEGYKQN